MDPTGIAVVPLLPVSCCFVELIEAMTVSSELLAYDALLVRGPLLLLRLPNSCVCLACLIVGTAAVNASYAAVLGPLQLAPGAQRTCFLLLHPMVLTSRLKHCFFQRRGLAYIQKSQWQGGL
jgi:hypothetical protein